MKVPRDSGTCTKCPMEVRIQSADGPWRCQIRLRRETDEHGVPLPSVRETAFGNPISDSYLIEAMLKRAQLAILNPSVEDSTKFVSLDLASVTEHSSLLGSTKQLDFSSNVICVDISGPDVTDLAFVDLPVCVSRLGAEEAAGTEASSLAGNRCKRRAENDRPRQGPGGKVHQGELLDPCCPHDRR